MKNKLILLFTIAAIAAAGFSSCQKVDEEAFDKSATERLDSMIEEVRSVLTGEENGWVMKYYIGADQMGGGYTYTIRFTSTDAEIGFEYAESIFNYEQDATLKSLYKIGNDNGPVLSFDTYNDFIHYFSTPSTAHYQALGGDFEFEIISVSEDRIEMVGRRSRNLIVLESLSRPAGEYIADVVNVANNFIPNSFTGTIGSTAVEGTIDYAYRQITIVAEEKEYVSAFCFTDTGISLYKPMEIGGVQIIDIAYDLETMKLSAQSIDMQGSVPADWIPYADYAGEYTFIYFGGDMRYDVELVPEQFNSTYRLVGLNPNFSLELKYNMQTGKLELCSQKIGTAEGYPIYFCAWALGAGGSVTWSSAAGMQTVWNGDKENPVYTFESNGFVWRTAAGVKCTADSFILFAIGDEIFYFDRSSWGTNGYAQWPYLTSLIRK